MCTIQTCRDTSDAVELCESLGLYLKTVARLNVSIQLPQMKTPGKSISNWEVMEKLRQAIRPEEFTTLKISKTTLEFIRFEGEVENKSALKTIVSRLEGSTVKLSGFPDNLRIRAAEAKVPFPTRHDWDSYFRDARDMDEMKPGERPDTIYVQGLPCKWFADKRRDPDRPSELLVRQAFSSLGEVRCLDIPLLDPYQKDMLCVGAADIHCEQHESMTVGTRMLSANHMQSKSRLIRVDFDKSQHLSEESITRRQQEKLKMEALEREREEREELRERKREEKQRRKEERKRREEEERRRKEEEAQRLKEAEEQRLREEEELRRKAEEEARKKREEEELKRQREEEERRRRVEEE
ncbi:splicing factor, arginine/serine-rich 17A, putative, partial [Ixodes scapularis]